MALKPQDWERIDHWTKLSPIIPRILTFVSNPQLTNNYKIMDQICRIDYTKEIIFSDRTTHNPHSTPRITNVDLLDNILKINNNTNTDANINKLLIESFLSIYKEIVTSVGNDYQDLFNTNKPALVCVYGECLKNKDELLKGNPRSIIEFLCNRYIKEYNEMVAEPGRIQYLQRMYSFIKNIPINKH